MTSNAERAARVLAHPDLADELRKPPASIRDPYSWSGWIPPRALPEEPCGDACGHGPRPCSWTQHRSKLNDSPIRKQLVHIATEAMRRDQTPDVQSEQGDVDAGQPEQGAAHVAAE